MHVPPTCFRSMRAVCIPDAASAVERGVPAWPEPMMMASYCCGVDMITLAIGCRQYSWRISESGNQQQSEPDCNQVLRDGNRHIRNVKSPNQPDASLISPERSSNSADCSDQRSEPIRRAPSNGETSTSKQANHNSCSEPEGSRTGRSGWEFIGNEFAQGANSKDAHRPGRTHEI